MISVYTSKKVLDLLEDPFSSKPLLSLDALTLDQTVFPRPSRLDLVFDTSDNNFPIYTYINRYSDLHVSELFTPHDESSYNRIMSEILGEK